MDPKPSQPHTVRNVVLAVAAALVVTVAVVLGLAYARVINIPFLPGNAAVSLLGSLDEALRSGEFDAEASVDVDADLSAAGMSLKMSAAGKASGFVSGFSVEDPCAAKVSDGAFSLTVKIPGLPFVGETSAAGSFALDLPQSTFDYALSEPVGASGRVDVDVAALRETIARNGGVPFDPAAVRDLQMHDDTIRFTLASEALQEVPELRQALEALRNSGVEASVNPGDFDVTIVVNDETGRVDANAKGPLHLALSGEGLSRQAFGINQIDGNLTLSIGLALTPRSAASAAS